jgi:hypothetical protein
MFSFITTTLIASVVALEGNFGLSYDNITDDGTVGANQNNTIKGTINALNIQAQVNELSFNATKNAPGQEDSNMQTGSNAASSITQSGVTTLIQVINALFVVPKAIFTAFAGFFGLGSLGTTLAAMLSIGLLIFLATMTFFRPG